MIRVFPRRTKWTPDDELAFIGDPPLFRPKERVVYISVTFTWDLPVAHRLQRAWGQYYDIVNIGGPALDDPGGEFLPGRYVKEGVTITSRGCCWDCPWCFVPGREGKPRELTIREGWIIQDNNLLACSRSHIEAVFDMCLRQKYPIEFKGGLDSRLLRQWHVDAFKRMKVKEFWFAADDEESCKRLHLVSDLMSDFPERKKRCFVMIGREETIEEAERRLKEVYALGFLPFAQLYQPKERIDYPKEWKDLARKWSRPAAYRSHRGEETGG